MDIKSYRMEIDLREHKQRVKLNARIEAEPYQPNVRAIPFKVGEDLGEYESHRLKKQMRIISARRGGVELPVVQEKWEGGFTVFLPESLKAREKLELDLTLEGDFMRDSESVEDCHYPRSNSSWFPRHGYLDRATFDLTFHHPKRHHVASVGARISEEIDPEDKDALVSKYQMMEPVALVTFALGALGPFNVTPTRSSGKRVALRRRWNSIHYRARTSRSKKTSSWRSSTTLSGTLQCSSAIIPILPSGPPFTRMVLGRVSRRC
jgi:hypothetical protein